jgi:hypothetical protein
MRWDGRANELAEQQYGVVATWQLRDVGATSTEISRMRRSAGWTPASSRVLRRSGSDPGDEQQLMAALLDAGPGAAICGTTAAAFWGAPGFRIDPVQVVRARGVSRRPSTLATVHEVSDLTPRQLKVVRGIAVVSPSRVVCELAGTHPHRAERVLDRFWSERLLDGRTFRRTVEELRDRGRTGSTLFRELDEARGPSYVPPASSLERRFAEVLEWHGQPPMVRQVDIGDDEEWCGRVDFTDPHLPLVVEIQSERYHSSLVDRAADARRRSRLEDSGAEVVEVWDTEVWHEPLDMVHRIAAARRCLLARLAA